MQSIRLPVVLILVFTIEAQALLAQQGTSDSSTSSILDLSGKWRVSRPVAPGFVPITLIQTGNRLEADIVQHVRCGTGDVTMRVTLTGSVQGRQVRLRATTGEMEGDFQNRRCNDAVFVGTADFKGQVSPDGRRIKGPYDLSNTPLHVWTFDR